MSGLLIAKAKAALGSFSNGTCSPAIATVRSSLPANSRNWPLNRPLATAAGEASNRSRRGGGDLHLAGDLEATRVSGHDQIGRERCADARVAIPVLQPLDIQLRRGNEAGPIETRPARRMRLEADRKSAEWQRALACTQIDVHAVGCSRAARKGQVESPAAARSRGSNGFGRSAGAFGKRKAYA